MVIPVFGLAAVTDAKGILNAIGGEDSNGVFNPIYQEYKPTTQTWVGGGQTNYWLAAAAVDPQGTIYVLGGEDTKNGKP